MKKKSNIAFSKTINIKRKNPNIGKNIFCELDNLHIFFCEGLILLKNVRNELKISYFNKKNTLFSYIDETVYLGNYTKKKIYAHNISLTKQHKKNSNQFDYFHNIIKKENLYKSFFSDLRSFLTDLSLKDSTIAGIGKSLINWKIENKYCPKCGEKFKKNYNFKWESTCSICKKIYFPRIDPVIIVLVINGNKTILGRSYHFPEKVYSCLAGFVEPGETLEMTALREIKEEVGIDIIDIKFVTNQPWPFPSSLMFGLIARAKNKKMKIDKKEIENAFWISKKNLKRILDGKNDNIFAARKGTIARYLLEKWVNNKI